MLAVIAVSIVMFSCKKEAEETIDIPTVEEEIAEVPQFVENCYLGIIKSDTITMHLKLGNDNLVEGHLNYKFFEKDNNEGKFVGTMKGDTLFADYVFMSEGKSSVREVVFLQKGNLMIEAYGDIEDKDGKMVFKDKKKLFFDSMMILSKTDCEVK